MSALAPLDCDEPACVDGIIPDDGTAIDPEEQGDQECRRCHGRGILRCSFPGCREYAVTPEERCAGHDGAEAPHFTERFVAQDWRPIVAYRVKESIYQERYGLTPAAASAYCQHGCTGYHAEPVPGHEWPSESPWRKPVVRGVTP